MGALDLKHANAMPAATWHRLRMNDTEVVLPAVAGFSAAAVEAEPSAFGENGLFEQAAAQLQQKIDATRAGEPADARAILTAADGSAAVDDLNVPALSSYERRAVQEEVENNVLAAFETGIGSEAETYLMQAAGGRTTLKADAGATEQAAVRIDGEGGFSSAAAIDIVAAPNSRFTLNVAFDSSQDGTGVAGLLLRVFAGAGAHVDVACMHTLGNGWTALDSEGYVLDENARVTVSHRVLGGGQTYVGSAYDLRGDASDLNVRTHYLGHGEQTRDFNYVVRHRGKKTTSNLDASGVLADSSRKVYRGTIDLVHGCKGAQGTERETVLLADEQVDNKTIPVILCDEDDVAGNHGATIGHVRPEQLNYLMSRGISRDAAERLFANATLEEAALAAPDERTLQSVARLARELGIPFELVESTHEEGAAR